MSVVVWIVLQVVMLPLLGVLARVLVVGSVVQVPSGRLGLLLVEGRATETAPPLGRDWLYHVRKADDHR